MFSQASRQDLINLKSFCGIYFTRQLFRARPPSPSAKEKFVCLTKGSGFKSYARLLLVAMLSRKWPHWEYILSRQDIEMLKKTSESGCICGHPSRPLAWFSAHPHCSHSSHFHLLTLAQKFLGLSPPLQIS